MSNYLSKLSAEEKDTLCAIPVYITLLIAGSDNKVERREVDWAERLMEFRATRNTPDLMEYYHEAERCWDDAYKATEAAVADKPLAERNQYLSALIAQANPLLAKVDNYFAGHLINSFRSFAVQVAKADGGVLGFGAVSPEENEWLSLPMLNHA